MTPKTRITTIILTYRRDDALADTIARLRPHIAERDDHELLLVDNNADGEDRSALIEGLRGAVITLGGNLGVTGGRNAGIRASSGDVLVFLDDDAFLEGDVGTYDRLLERFDSERELGVVSFRSWMRERDQHDPIEFPHTNKALPRDRAFETFRFIGVGHAMRKDAIDRVGLYPESFFYGMEEFEMSFRLMKADYRITYDPAFTVTHMKADSGRLVRKDVIERMYANKLYIAWTHLPLREALTCASAWGVKTILDSRDVRSIFRSIMLFTSNVKTERAERSPSCGVVNRIRQLGGVPWK
ncbi:glycosyltransferase [Agrobacterium rubi]|nr:glycosyltransferase [Agrobacterium rubi]NTF24683.1 glycosyltransferase [Agrobacterium rubi]